MSKQRLGEIEPVMLHQHVPLAPIASDSHLKKLTWTIGASEVLVLATAIAQAVVGGLEMRENVKNVDSCSRRLWTGYPLSG
jgi:hypothetical protein